MCGCTMRSPRGVGWLDGAWRDGRLVIPWVFCERGFDASVVSMRMVMRRLSEVVYSPGRTLRTSHIKNLRLASGGASYVMNANYWISHKSMPKNLSLGSDPVRS